MIPIEIAYVFAFLFYVASVLIHVMVLSKKFPYTAINGGRSKDFNEQKKQSITSIIVLVVLLTYVLITMFIPSFRMTIMFLIITSLLVLFWLLGTVMQLLGTKFEKQVVVWINLVGFLSHVLILFSYFKL